MLLLLPFALPPFLCAHVCCPLCHTGQLTPGFRSVMNTAVNVGGCVSWHVRWLASVICRPLCFSPLANGDVSGKDHAALAKKVELADSGCWDGLYKLEQATYALCLPPPTKMCGPHIFARGKASHA